MSRSDNDDRFAALRGSGDPTLANMIQWERIKLWDAAREALALIDDRSPATPDVAEALWGDAEFDELRRIMRKHRARLAELEKMQSEAETELAEGPPLPE